MAAVIGFAVYSLNQDSDNCHILVGLTFDLVFVMSVANKSFAVVLELAPEPVTDAEQLK